MRSSRLLALLAFALLLVSCASNDPLEPDEEESFENLYVPTEYADISEAAAAAVAGDTIRVSAGEYEEDVLLPTGVLLLGAGFDHVRLIGGLTVVDSDRSVRVEGFTIHNEFGSGVLLQDTNLRMTRCFVESCTTAGIEIVGDGGPKVEDCHISQNAIGVLIRDAGVVAHYDDFDHPGGLAPKIIQCNLFDNGGIADEAFNVVFRNISAPDTVGVSNNYWGIVPVDEDLIEGTIYDHKDGGDHVNGLADTEVLQASPLILDVP